MIEVGNHLCRLTGPTPSAQSRVRKAVYPGLCSNRVLISLKWRLHDLSRQTVPVLSHTRSTKGGFLAFKWNFLCFRWCALPIVLSLGRTKSLTVFFTPLHQEFIHINKIFLKLLLLRLSQWLQYERCSNLLITSVVLHWTLVFSSQPCTGEPRTGPSAADGLHQGWGEVEIPFGFSWYADRMHKICRNSQSSRKET